MIILAVIFMAAGALGLALLLAERLAALKKSREDEYDRFRKSAAAAYALFAVEAVGIILLAAAVMPS